MKFLGGNENLPYKCGNLPNPTVTYGHNIYWAFLKYVRTTKPPALIPILSKKKLNVMNSNFINGNEISTYYEAYDSNRERKFFMVIMI